jgi:hypothetical protein
MKSWKLTLGGILAIVIGIALIKFYFIPSGAWNRAMAWFQSPPTPTSQTRSVPVAQLTPTVQELVLSDEPTHTPTITLTPRIYQPMTWMQLVRFLSDDHTNWNTYDPNKYVCLDFAVDLVANATQKNIKAWVVGVTFSTNERDHAFVGFETTDYGVVYIEPQGDNPYWGMAVGKPLCDSWGEYKCMGTVSSIQYLQCDHLQNCTPYTP